ncbi:hypothetical protein CBR_g8223 [Chara braunii]|uniref:B box-type domain-containing protein n=1 Tax=Chara braunii TaxID=69332 RepID=A0A388KLJ7_CHABU|nr:hypothetical protein CBR_g8223 [Chara braunii]|eukprot:GBG70921.1 hypothetical protein CBR_g8223 [Chara braunii]
MRTLCDVCEAAPAQYFCAADEAALCMTCDEKVHGCNKLASRHVRLELAEARAVPRCDICENAPAFFFCGIDGTSLCLQCDMDVHTGGKKAHARYLLMGQRVELPMKKVREVAVAGAMLKSQPVKTQLSHHHQHSKQGRDVQNSRMQVRAAERQRPQVTERQSVCAEQPAAHSPQPGCPLKSDTAGGGDGVSPDQVNRGPPADCAVPAMHVTAMEGNERDDAGEGESARRDEQGRTQERECIDLNSRPRHLKIVKRAEAALEQSRSSDDDCPGVVPEVDPGNSSGVMEEIKAPHWQSEEPRTLEERRHRLDTAKHERLLPSKKRARV